MKPQVGERYIECIDRVVDRLNEQLAFIYDPGTPRAYIVQLVDRAALERLGDKP